MTGSNTNRAFTPRSRSAASRGFALLVAVILSAVAAAITVALTTLAYKNLLLSSAAEQSQYAFYAADSALECELYWDNSAHNDFTLQSAGVQNNAATINCEGTSVRLGYTSDGNTTHYYITSPASGWFPINAINGSSGYCASLDIYIDNSTGVTDAFANGTNNSTDCSTFGPRAVERGIKATY